jgi:DNA polymerase-4
MSIDEAYLDVSEVLFTYKGDYKKLAFNLKEEVKNTLGITCSIGVSSNKVCSKIASRINKPDGITIIPPGKEKEFLKDLPVERIPGVGKATLKKLNKYGIKVIGDLTKFEKRFYESEIGMFSSYLLNVANGIDDREICLFDDYEQKSLSKESTLRFDTSDKEFLKKELYYLLEKACSRLRVKKLKSKTITVKVKYSDFVVNQKSFTRNHLSNMEVDFYDDSMILMSKLLLKGRKIRLLGVRFTELKEDDTVQEHLFNDEEKYKNLLEKLDKIRKKYNYDTITFGKTFKLED